MSAINTASSNISSGLSSVGDATRNIAANTASTASSIGSTATAPSATSSFGSSISSTPSASTNNGSFSSLLSSTNSSGQTESSFWNSSLLLGVVGLVLFIFFVGNIYMYATTGEALFWEELLSGVSTVTGAIKTFFDNLMNSSQVGGKGVVEVSGETVKSAASIPADIVKGSQDKKSSDTTKDTEEVDSDSENESSKEKAQNNLEKKIDKSAVTSTSQQEQRPQDIDYSGPEPNETQSKSTGASSIGFCYIGEYNGTRSCASVKESSNCMSGDIFDTKELCVNPRA